MEPEHCQNRREQCYGTMFNNTFWEEHKMFSTYHPMESMYNIVPDIPKAMLSNFVWQKVLHDDDLAILIEFGVMQAHSMNWKDTKENVEVLRETKEVLTFLKENRIETVASFRQTGLTLLRSRTPRLVHELQKFWNLDKYANKRRQEKKFYSRKRKGRSYPYQRNF